MLREENPPQEPVAFPVDGLPTKLLWLTVPWAHTSLLGRLLVALRILPSSRKPSARRGTTLFISL
ncbi:hypothetical protein GB937_002728 [Aspergillus fischeri]|nr:hypothetical protein GB937_002728 [Aspergillus fischeri]